MQRFLRFFLCLALSALGLAEAGAVPAYPGTMRVKQGDGTWLTIRKMGDERAHIATSTDGYPLLLNAATNNYEYARIENGHLVSSGIRATEVDRRDAKASSFLKTVSRDGIGLALHNGVRRAPAQVNKIRISDIPTTGHQKVLVVLVQFTDRTFQMSDPESFYTNLLNERNYTNTSIGATGSAYDYYSQSSFGQYDPEFVVAGPVTMPHGYAYYGGNSSSYGTSSDNYQRIAEMISEACKAVDDSIDFSEYDTDHDGYVDNVYVFYAGRGEADSYDTNAIWPHSSYLSSISMDYAVRLDGVRVNRYACSQEINGQTGRTVGIGTFVHEFGHVLGLADHYNTQDPYATGQLNAWDVMASGSYSNNQNTPPLFSAFERAELGWLNYTALDPKTDSVLTLPCLQDSNRAYRVSVPGNDNEYFVLENRQLKGFDRFLPGHGMVVWHIDMDRDAWWANTPNNDPTHQRVDIVEADGSANCDGGDPFPGTSRVTEFSFKDWDGDELFSFATVDETDSLISFLLGGTDFDITAPDTIIISNLKGRSMNVAWHVVSGAAYYNLHIVSPTDSLVYDNLSVTKVDVTGLSPETQYTVSVCAGLANYLSEARKTTVTTPDLQLDERQVNALPATEVDSTSFTANWEPVEGAEEYLLTVYKRQMSGRETSGCSFTSMASGLPDGWTSNSKRYSNTYYGNAAPSLRLSRDGDWLAIDGQGKKMVELNFWYRSSVAGNTLMVETAANDGTYTTIDSITTDAQPHTLKVELPNVGNVRLRLVRTDGYLCIDDAAITSLTMESVPVDTLSDIHTGKATSFAVKGLTSGETYTYSVVAAKGTVTSLPSDEIVVELPKHEDPVVDAIHSTVTGSATREVFDLQGRRVNTNAMPSGIYIIRENGVSRKVVKK